MADKKINDELGDTKKSTLGNYVTFYNGLKGMNSTNFSNENSNAKYIQFKNIHENNILEEELGDVYVEELDKQNKVIKGDLLLTGSSENIEEVGTTNINTISKNNLFVNSFSYIMRPSNIDSLYLHYLLKAPTSRKQIMLAGQGITRINLSPSRISNMKISVHNEHVQKKIAILLSSIDDLIEESSKLEELYTLQKNSYMQNVFDIKSNFIDKSWKLNYLGDIFEIITDYVAAGSFADVKKNVTYRSDPDHAMLVRCTDLKSKFTSKEFVYVDKHAYDFLYRVNIDEDCIVLPNIGNIGESYFCNRDVLPYKHNILGPNTIMVRSKKNNNKFLYYITQTKQFRDELFKIAGGSGMLKFNKTDLKKIKIQIPIDYNEQEKISNVLSSFDELIDYQRAITSEYKKVKQYHLNNIFK